MALNIGVIGTGAIGRDHIRRCSKVLQGARVVAVNDINRDNAAKVVSDLQLDARVYDNGHDLIKAADVQAVLVTSRGPSHEEFVLAAIAAGKPVFCEAAGGDRAGLQKHRRCRSETRQAAGAGRLYAPL